MKSNKLELSVNGKPVEATNVRFVIQDGDSEIEVRAGCSEEGGPWMSMASVNKKTGKQEMTLEVQ